MTSVLELTLTDTSGEVVLSTEVPAQDLTLRYVRVEFSSTTSMPPVLYLGLPFVGASSTVASHNIRGIPIPIVPGLTQIHTPNLTVGINQSIPERFRYDIRANSGVLTNFVSLTVVFEYSVGSIF